MRKLVVVIVVLMITLCPVGVLSAKDLYKVLGLSRGASESQIKKAYRKLAMENHPDKNPGDEDAAQRFAEVGNGTESTWRMCELAIPGPLSPDPLHSCVRYWYCRHPHALLREE